MPYNFYSIATSIAQREQLPSHKWWHHNKYVAQMLGVTEEELDVFVLQCEKGYSNTREQDTAVKYPAPFDVPIKLKCVNDFWTKGICRCPPFLIRQSRDTLRPYQTNHLFPNATGTDQID
jgi:hypothetical protein